MILIISSFYDESTNLVCKQLLTRRSSFARVNIEDEIHVQAIKISDNGTEVLLQTKKRIISLNDVAVVWYRNGFFFRHFLTELVKEVETSTVVYKYHCDEIETLNNFIFSLLEEKSFLGNYSNGSPNKFKILQFAAETGLKIPSTIVTSNKDFLLSEFNETPIVIKPIKDAIPVLINEELYSPYTRSLNMKELQEDSFFPVCFQENIEPELELRIFFIEERYFTVAILSHHLTNKAIRDWRFEFKRGNVSLTKFNLPFSIEKKLQILMDRVRINSGSIDMIVSKEWEYYFLEVNPTGEFRFVSEVYEDCIEKVIAEKIIEYANKKTITDTKAQ